MSKQTSNNIQLQIGDKVRLLSSRALGEILEGPDRRGRYRLSIGSLTLYATAEEFDALPRKRKNPTQTDTKKKPRKSSSGPTLRCDLHGLTKAQALEALENCLNQALLQGSQRIEVVHGIGKGILKSAANAYFKSCPQVAQIKPDLHNPGVFWVYL